MNTVVRNIVGRTYKPWLERYLVRTRVFRQDGLKLLISPDVFHPGFFFSTQLLLGQIRSLPLEGKTLLEPGCGSALISFFAAKAGAVVTASDINAIAILFARENCLKNGLDLTIIESDLFEKIPATQFDIIAINPPYYKKNAVSAKDYAWCCGENGEYFRALFAGLSDYTHPESAVFMVLFEGCDFDMIHHEATKNNWRLQLVREHRNLLEKNFIYKIEGL